MSSAKSRSIGSYASPKEIRPRNVSFKSKGTVEKELPKKPAVSVGSKSSAPPDPFRSAPTATDSATVECGYGEFRPKWMQLFHNAKCLVACLSMCSIFQGILVNGLIPISLSMLERRFRLTSTESGFFASFYDIAVMFCVLPVSHFGGTGNKPRWLGVGMFIMGAGALILAMPQFLVEKSKSDAAGVDWDLCRNNIPNSPENGTVLPDVSSDKCHGDSNYWHYRGLFFVLLLGQLFHGVGASPLYTLGITYLDENVAQSSSPVYLGFFYGFSVFGPAVGFITGAQLLKIYGDFGEPPKGVTPEDPLWYGAWWLGFIIFGILSMVLSVPMVAFAPRLPGVRAERKKDIDQAHGPKSKKMSPKIKDFPKEIWNISMNYPYMCLIAMKSTEAFIMNAFVNFIPKMMENFFSLSSSKSSFLSGAVIIPGGLLGTIIGGYAVKGGKMMVRSMLIMAAVCQFVSMFFIFGFLIVCPESRFIGVNEPQANLTVNNVTDTCDVQCGCKSYSIYNPVCDQSTNLIYYSPCQAGCLSKVKDQNGLKSPVWTDCQCLRDVARETIFKAERNVTAGYCPATCNWSGIFILLCGFQIFITFMAAMPIQQVELRCVPFEKRTLAVCFSWIFVRALGSIPGPIVLGKIIDLACVLWQTECGAETSCLRYDSNKMSLWILVVGVAFKIIICAFLALALLLYRPVSLESSKKTDVAKSTDKTPVKQSIVAKS